jgi:hypothetical protein
VEKQVTCDEFAEAISQYPDIRISTSEHNTMYYSGDSNSSGNPPRMVGRVESHWNETRDKLEHKDFLIC